MDLALLRAWWDSIRLDAPAQVVGLWFGMADLVTEEGTARHLYAAACPTFDAADPGADWATEYVWGPSEPVLLPGLAAVPDSRHLIALDRAVELVRLLRPWDDVPARGVAVGFDDGDFVLADTGR